MKFARSDCSSIVFGSPLPRVRGSHSARTYASVVVAFGNSSFSDGSRRHGRLPSWFCLCERSRPGCYGRSLADFAIHALKSSPSFCRCSVTVKIRVVREGTKRPI